MQRWKRVVGNPDYLVSNMGRVWSKKSNMLLKQQENPSHPYLSIKINGETKMVHRLVAEAFLANPEMKPQVHHIDHNPRNNDVLNLMWVTDAENKKYCHENGGYKGENARNTKLTELDVRMIRYHYEEGHYNYKELAELFDVTSSNIGRIIRRITWSYI